MVIVPLNTTSLSKIAKRLLLRLCEEQSYEAIYVCF